MTYEQINEALKRLQAGMDAAESHGVLSGLLAAGDESAQTHWLAHCAPEVEPGDLLAEEALDRMKDLFSETGAQMKSPDFGFRLLLPEDETPLPERLQALAHWCQGFLMGISLAGIADTGKLPGELPGFVSDLLEFTHLGEFETGDASDEQSWSELNEYVRMGVLLFHEEIRALRENEDQRNLH